MCGICILIFSKKNCEILEGCHFCSLNRRGPDAQNGQRTEISSKLDGYLFGSTLHFRGHLTPQPIQDSCGNVLLWNGEIFGGIQVLPEENDGQVLLTLLQKSPETVNILESFANIQGPWAAVYWQAATRKLWFARDVFGRRSLLCHTSEDIFALSSVKMNDMAPWREVPAVGVYCVQYSEPQEAPVPSHITLYPWAHCKAESTTKVIPAEACLVFNETLHGKTDWIPSTIEVGIYGVQCPFVRFNTELIAIHNDQSPPTESVEQLENTSIKDCSTLRDNSMSPINLRQENIGSADKAENDTDSVETCKKDQPGENRADDVDKLVEYATGEQIELAERLTAVLGDAVCTRVQAQSHKCNACHLSEHRSEKAPSSVPHNKSENVATGLPYCGHTRVAVLFSGGIDSLMITALADRYVPQEEPIDLLNVAFEQQPKKTPATAKKKGKYIPSGGESFDPYNVPDRETGLAGLKQLCKLSPGRQWNFVKIDVPLVELQEIRASRVKDLVYPLNTVLDDSIGCAVWFAARGQGEVLTSGRVSGSPHWAPYTTTARLVLVGMGADEQLCGYSRHRTRFRENGIEGLTDEIKMEIERISSRNLGRDDRIISDHGRESRLPFLDERVVSFLNSLPVSIKANLTLPRGIGEKYLLRLAAIRLGLEAMALLPKRAIQFGSRVAKAENRKEQASDICDRLLE